jgi:hypothetical protein
VKGIYGIPTPFDKERGSIRALHGNYFEIFLFEELSNSPK